MAFSFEIMRSVADVWLVWLAAIVSLAVLVSRAGRRKRWRNFSRLLADERGASYALPYVLTFPIYLLLMCVIIQSTLILMVKTCSVYAAYSAARAAIVWRSAEPIAGNNDSTAIELVKEKAKLAAALAMAPLATARSDHYGAVAVHHADNALRTAETALTLSVPYNASYRYMQLQNVAKETVQPPPRIIPREMADKPATVTYLYKKLRFALMATDVVVTIPDKNEFNGDLTAEVHYAMPMSIPGAGRILGNWRAVDQFYAREIVTQVTLPLETPQSEDQRLGIPYVSDGL